MPKMIALMMLLLVPQVSWAKKVYSPHAEQGVLELETQTDVVFDANPAKDGFTKHQLELSYGLRDWWSSGLYIVFEKPGNGGGYAYAESKWENIFVLSAPKWVGLDWGLYAEYIWAAPSSRKSDVLEGKLLLEKRIGHWTHTANLALKQTLASGEGGPFLGYAWRSRYAFQAIELAVEAYGGLGAINRFLPPDRQSHLVGPVLTMEPFDDFEVELGWLMDVNAGLAYGNLKLNLELEF